MNNTLHGKGEELLMDVMSLLGSTSILESASNLDKFSNKWGINTTSFILSNFLIPITASENQEIQNFILKKLAMFLASFNDPISTSTEMEFVIGLN